MANLHKEYSKLVDELAEAHRVAASLEYKGPKFDKPQFIKLTMARWGELNSLIQWQQAIQKAKIHIANVNRRIAAKRADDAKVLAKIKAERAAMTADELAQEEEQAVAAAIKRKEIDDLERLDERIQARVEEIRGMEEQVVARGGEPAYMHSSAQQFMADYDASKSLAIKRMVVLAAERHISDLEEKLAKLQKEKPKKLQKGEKPKNLHPSTNWANIMELIAEKAAVEAAYRERRKQPDPEEVWPQVTKKGLADLRAPRLTVAAAGHSARKQVRKIPRYHSRRYAAPSYHNYRRYIHKELEQLNKGRSHNLTISKTAMNVINDMMVDIAYRITTEAGAISIKTGTKTLSSRDVQSATALVLTGALAEHAKREGYKAVLTYSS